MMRNYIDLFIEYLQYERNYSAHTVVAYMKDLTLFADYIDGKTESDGEQITIDRIDADIVREWIISMMEHTSSESVNRRLSTLKSFFKYLIRQGVIKKHPLTFVAGPKNPKNLPYFVKDDDMESALDESNYSDEFKDVRDRLVIELLYETGLRRSELVGIKDADIDMQSMTMKVLGKRNKQRIIPFADRLKEMIINYQKIRNNTIGETEYFFVRKNGQQITTSIVYYIVEKHLSDIPTLSKRSPHVLRHSFATAMLNNGAEIEAVKELLGHSSLASTSVYTHVTFEELKKMYHAHPRAKI